MGKNTDKLYITHSEWASDTAFSASAGSGVTKGNVPGAFKRLPYNFCALSLQPFEHPVCTNEGTIFDLTNILPWLKKHGTNPVDGAPLKSADLIKLNFAKNDDGEYVDPVTYKVFTDNTHIVALKVSGNVFAWDTVERLNIKAKNWKDLVSDQDFSRKDIITLQDPQNIESRDLSSFKYIQEGASTLTPEQEAERSAGVNSSALGNAAKILKAKEAVAKARADRQNAAQGNSLQRAMAEAKKSNTASGSSKPVPYNAAQYTTGKAAASFTSTGISVHTGNERALLSDKDYMLKPKRIKHKGYARLQTNHGEINVELHTDLAPKAVWNFVRLAQKGYYKNIPFHRNIRNFMIQGGDPTGTGRGGQSIWGKNFADETENSLVHDSRGILSMANKGKDTNSSQFFITYRAVPHLNKKHTIFGRVVGGTDTLSRLEAVKTDEGNRPIDDCTLEDVVVFVDPFEEFQKERMQKEDAQKAKEEIQRQGGTEDDKTTWTGKRIRGNGTVEDAAPAGVGKYLKTASAPPAEDDEIVGEWEEPEPPKKKAKSGGFGNFDNW
ncbi:peptidyl-prolyl cis-trans isomeras-like protein-like 2 [Aureobasidium pullulans]|nr:peptidyl-prolyl cis-trans isomeras-like protein-like 2 [Aureobasidium pullulans]